MFTNIGFGQTSKFEYMHLMHGKLFGGVFLRNFRRMKNMSYLLDLSIYTFLSHSHVHSKIIAHFAQLMSQYQIENRIMFIAA